MELIKLTTIIVSLAIALLIISGTLSYYLWNEQCSKKCEQIQGTNPNYKPKTIFSQDECWCDIPQAPTPVRIG